MFTIIVVIFNIGIKLQFYVCFRMASLNADGYEKEKLEKGKH